MTEHDSPLPPLSSLIEHRSWVRAVARRLVRDEHAAEDLAQDAWVQTMRSPPAPDRDPRPWLRRVLKNLASNRRRGAGRRTHHEHAWREQREQRSPASLVAEAEQHRRLVSHVLDLEEPFRTVLVLRFYEGLTPPQIAARMDTAVGTVHSRLSRATARLKARLDDEEQGDRKAWIAALLPLADARGLAPAAAGAGAATATAGVLMSFTKSKLAWVGLILFVTLVAGGIHLAGDLAGGNESSDDVAMLEAGALDEDQERDEGAALLAADGTSRGPDVPEATQPVTLQSRTYRGRVVEDEGRAVAGAYVFALPHGSTGVSEDDLLVRRFGLTRTDSEGRFQVTLGEMDRPRLIAWSDDLLPASVALQDLDPEKPITLKMGGTRWLRVRVEQPRDLVDADLGFRLRTLEEGHERTDDPALQGLVMFLDEPGVAEEETTLTVRLNTTAPVLVVLDPPAGFAAMPRSVLVKASDPAPTMRIVPSAQVRYELIDAETGKPIEPGPRTRLWVQEVGMEGVVAGRSSRTPSFGIGSRLTPGQYRYVLNVEGYEPLEGEFRVRVGGEQLAGRLELIPRPKDAETGRLLLRIEKGDPPTAAVQAIAAIDGLRESKGELNTFVRIHGGTMWFPTKTILLEDGRLLIRPWKRAPLETNFPPGTYDIYIASRGTGLAGSLSGVRLFADQDNELGIRIGAGTFFRLADALGADAPMHDLDLRAGGLERLPALVYSRGGYTVFLTESNLRELLMVPRRNRLVGPFPAGTLEIQATDENGRRRTIRVSGANEIKGQ